MSTARFLALTVVALLALAAFPAGAAEPVSKLRVVGGLAAAPRYARLEAPFWTQRLPQLSGGRYSAEIVPFDRAGVPGQEMLRLMQLGVVQFGTALFSNIAASDPEINAPDLAGLNPDMATLRRNLAAFRPYLEKMLRERYGIHVLAIYVYPAQVLFCKTPLTSLRDLDRKRVRVSGPSAADFLGALGARPVVIEFSQIVPSVRSGSSDCAVTGTMSGNALGLHEVTTYLHPMPITWGLALFGANADTWDMLPADLKVLLQRELPRLEAAIWADAERETSAGIACNLGKPECGNGRKGGMRLVNAAESEQRLRREIFERHVLPRWIERCGPSCAQLWDRTLAPLAGIKSDGR